MTRRPSRIPLFWRVALAFALVWLLLDQGLPRLAMRIAGHDRPLPTPWVARAAYLLLALIGCAVHVTLSDASMREFRRPVAAFLRGPGPGRPLLARARLLALLLLPLAAGAAVYAASTPGVESPTRLRVQHPTLPGAYERLRNPFRDPEPAALRQWMAKRGMGGDVEAGRQAYTRAALEEGRLIFQVNCRPCHGAAADGQGPMARGFRLRPADFTDPGTIATVVEAYAFWRVSEGGPGLPPEASPWDSAMPAWKEDLTEAQRWQVAMAAYELAGVEPRRPERLGAAGAPGAAWAQPAPPAPDPARLERGRQIYVARCLPCHGEQGDGQGPVAPYLEPRPRDFVTGAFRLRTTASGEPPTDLDLFRVVTRGVPGTAMPGWTALSEADRWLVVQYVKTLGEAFREPGTAIHPEGAVAASPEAIARGETLYQRAKCWECHGQQGRGDGPAAATLVDDRRDRIRATDLTKGWRLKGGREAGDIFMRLTTGMDGTPMPSFADALSEEERWAIAHYVRSLQTAEEPGDPVVLRALRLAGEAPRDPGDPRWARAPFLAVPLAGQVLVPPRWQNPSVDAVTVRAVAGDSTIAFRLEWSDPAPDAEHAPGPDPALGPVSYPRRDLAAVGSERLRDAVRLQFPASGRTGGELPHFFLGSAGRPVILWHWQADREAAGRPAVVTELADGSRRPVRPREGPAPAVEGHGVWRDGRWQVVMSRALEPADRAADVAFPAGRPIPFAVQVWDGANGEKGQMLALSSWVFVAIEAPRSAAAPAVPLAAVALVGSLEWWLVRRARGSRAVL